MNSKANQLNKISNNSIRDNFFSSVHVYYLLPGIASSDPSPTSLKVLYFFGFFSLNRAAPSPFKSNGELATDKTLLPTLVPQFPKLLLSFEARGTGSISETTGFEVIFFNIAPKSIK